MLSVVPHSTTGYHIRFFYAFENTKFVTFGYSAMRIPALERNVSQVTDFLHSSCTSTGRVFGHIPSSVSLSDYGLTSQDEPDPPLHVVIFYNRPMQWPPTALRADFI